MTDTETIEKMWNLAASAMASGDLENGTKYYREVISALLQAKSDDPSGPGGLMAEDNLGNAYFDLSGCLLQTDGLKVNDGVHALLSAVECGFREPAVYQNLLYCMGIVNKMLAAKIECLEDNEANRQLVHWHNEGYDLLKTPDPPGTPNRNWIAAGNAYVKATQINPTLASAYHGLGLAREGMKKKDMEADAISAWSEVKRLDPEYNFEYRYKYRLQ